ncbi:PREDICTED: segmentation protein cap'n'collar-like isoform X2 [Nicrophorus vespilloides]|uniref:Segmentation protein cap'n'collar-like isoform X2 n=1 Tax=Nicrophorus vespilloides TaxID=110193 RepID=A0ABM1MS16_NICVS|nr:PREDICTED: segmentation protein cap'n'collar-like isoform X2 [Nicrophorus vespilloides]
MLSLKKVYCDELLQLALILSLLRSHPDSHLETDILSSVNNYDLDNGTSWRSMGPSLLRSHYVHPKSLDTILMNYEREVFADLNSLGRYHRANIHQPNITAYLLNVDRTAAEILPEIPTQPPVEEPTVEPAESPGESNVDNSLELTQEDMDLIEVLWKQDVDLGVPLEVGPTKPEKLDPDLNSTPTTSKEDGNLDDIKTLKEFNESSIKIEPESQDLDPWAGLNYTVDTETGEYVIKGELEDSLTGAECGPSCDLPLGDLSLPLPEFFLEQALQLVGLEDDAPQEAASEKALESGSPGDSDPDTAVAGSSTSTTATGPLGIKESESEDEFDIFGDMIQTQFHHPHHRAFQGRMPIVRTMSMEQRWQDLANLLSLPSPGDSAAMAHPFSHHHHALHNYSHPHTHGMGYGPDAARGVLLHNATLTPPMGDINSTVPYSNLGGTNLGNAVATSMNLTNSSEPMGEPSNAGHYKLEPTHDMMYYQNTTSDLNQTDGFLSSILNDEDLQLMDMAMNEGMYTMRMLDSNNAVSNLSMSSATGAAPMSSSRVDVERMDTSSDSAVSSMGSERVPSLSDGEWCDAGSDSGHTAGDHYVNDYTKYRPYDYSYSSRQHSTTTFGPSDANRLPVAQKKHHMFGKRCFQEQGSTQAQAPIKYEYRDPGSASVYNSSNQAEGAIPKPPEIKYPCNMEFRHNLARNHLEHIQHNHTYHLPVESTGAMQRPISRDKMKSRKAEEEHLTRDEKRARALSVPISVDEIINLPMDEFNERLSKYDLSEAQLSLIRDIRRRGKNKVAAQNCRKRKLDQILSLADEVKDMRDRKIRLLNEHEYLSGECQRVKDKYQQLYRHVFQNLRDPEGNQYSPYQYSLQTSADGSILVVPRANSSITNPERKEPHPPGRKE